MTRHSLSPLSGLLLLTSLATTIACGAPTASVTTTLTPPQAELTLALPSVYTSFEVVLAPDAPAVSGAHLSLVACVEEGIAGLPCEVDRDEEPSPFEQPDAWVSFVREDNQVLPLSSVDARMEALYDGAFPRSFTDPLFDEEDPTPERLYSARFDRGDALEQVAGIADPTLHVVWTVSATAIFPDVEPGTEDPRWLGLRVVDIR